MTEPHLSRFREMVRAGAAVQDIHDAAAPVGYAATEAHANDRYVDRETRRVEAHQQSLLPLLERFVGPVKSILDVGCSTGGTTVALALSPVLRADEVVGLDPNGRAIDAARVRMQGYGIEPGRLKFQQITPKQRLPFPDARFDVATCVSVLEFVSERKTRAFLAAELQRVTRPGGYMFISTPSPWRFREYHSRRLLGNFRPGVGDPWSSTPAAIRRMFRPCDEVTLSSFVVRDALRRRRIPAAWLLSMLHPVVARWLPWQRYLFRKPA